MKETMAMTLPPLKGFRAGMIDSIGVGISFVFLFVSTGALCVASHLSFWQSILMTALIFAAPLQIIILQHIGAASPELWLVFVLSLLVNFRFFLMTAAFFPYFKHQRTSHLLMGLFGLSASSFAISFPEFKNNPRVNHFQYYLGSMLVCYVTGVISTGIGFELAHSIQSPYLMAILAMILPINFTLLTAKYWPKFKPIIITLLGFVLFPIVHSLAPQLALLILPLVLAAVLMGYDHIQRKQLV